MKKFTKFTAALLSGILTFGALTAVPMTAGAAEMAQESAQSSAADTTLLPTAKNNISVGLKSKSSLTAVSGGYMRVYYDGDATIGIEYYDKNFNITSKKSIAMELDIWGGFYAGNNAYYVVEGQNNEDESDTAEVIRVIKYSTSWKRLGSAAISTSTANENLFGSEVRYPFDGGCVEMSEHDGTLFVVTGHEGYVDDSVGQGHQGYLMLAVDESTMTGKIVDSDLYHSFAQYIETDGDDLYVLEQSEGGRCTKLSKRNADAFANAQYNWDGNYSSEYETSISVLDYGGTRTSAWAVACYASVDDLAVSEDNVLSLGTSIDQSEYDNVTDDTAHNIYLTVTPKSDFTEEATTVKWLTLYADEGQCFYGTKITKVNDDRFLVTWEEVVWGENNGFEKSREIFGTDTLSTSTLHYVFVDGNGEKISDEYTAAAPISDCHPILSGSKIVYYASNETAVNFYAIDVNTGDFSEKHYQVVGENASWSLEDGTLTISGSGTLTSFDSDDCHRYPVSSATNVYRYTNSGIWSDIRKNVKKLVVRSGITSIGDNVFSRITNLSKVIIEDGLQSIGDEAFAHCSGYQLNVIIPDSVTEIGEYVMLYNYVSSDHKEHSYGTIYANSGSYAIQYAEDNGIDYVLLDAEDVYEYELLDDDTVKITKCTSSAIDLTIPSTIDKHTVTGIDMYAFANCNILESVKIPDSVTDISFLAFRSADSLMRIDVASSNQYYSSEDGVLFNKDKTELCAYPEGKTNETYVIPGSVKSIDYYAFQGCTNLTSITIPDGVTSIKSWAFEGCENLENIVLPDSVTSIDNGAFAACYNLTSVVIPNKVKSIEHLTFNYCTSLTSVTIPESVVSIDKEAFYNCNNENIVIYGYTGTVAETYANDNGFTFVSTGTVEPTTTKPTEAATATVPSSSTKPTGSTEPSENITLGDVNGDGVVDISDATAIQKAVAKITEFTETQQKAADVNGDGTVDISDATMIQKFVAKIITSFTAAK